MIRGDGEVGRSEEGCVGCMVERLPLAVVMELLTGCAAKGRIAGGVNRGGTSTGAVIKRIRGIYVCKKEESDTDCDCSKLGYGKVDSTN
jgi:hypothetical protein